jgi:hypothetical protein
MSIAVATLSACGSSISRSSSIGATEPDAGATGAGPVDSGSLPSEDASSPSQGGADGGPLDGGPPLSNDASGPSLGGTDLWRVEGGSPPSEDASGPSPGDADAGNRSGTYCAVAPWTNSPTAFATTDGRGTIPAGTYTLRYVSGAQIHDASEGYEVTTHYVAANNIEAGHHLFNGASPETSSTSVWLDGTGLVGSLPTVADVEQQNAGHTWTFQHAGGPLLVTFYDDYYGDNQGPGTLLCLDVSP